MSWVQLQTEAFDDGDSPVSLASLLPAELGTGHRGAVRFEFDNVGTVDAYVVQNSTDTLGVLLKADAQYDYGGEAGLAWPGPLGYLRIPAGGDVNVTVFVTKIRP